MSNAWRDVFERPLGDPFGEHALQEELWRRLCAISLPWRCITALRVTPDEYEVFDNAVKRRYPHTPGRLVFCGIPLKVVKESPHAA